MNQYMEAAMQEAAQCWCDDETSSKQMDHVLAEAFAKRLAVWMESTMQMARNAAFYCSLLDQCAEHLGREAYTADDGTVMGEPVRLKIPELVAERCASGAPQIYRGSGSKPTTRKGRR